VDICVAGAVAAAKAPEGDAVPADSVDDNE